MDVPKPGDVVYIDTSLYLSHGRDDVRGGKARVVGVRSHSIAGPTEFIEVAEDPGTWHNWDLLAAQQDELSKKFGDTWAHPDPDMRPEANEW